MNPAVARKLLESFDDALSVQLFVQTELTVTNEEDDVLPVETLFNLYRQWPPRVRMPEAKFIEILKVTCRLDVFDEEPAVIVGVACKNGSTKKPKGKYQKKPPPPMQAIQRAARFATNVERAKALGISPRALRGLCKRNPEVAALFSRV